MKSTTKILMLPCSVPQLHAWEQTATTLLTQMQSQSQPQRMAQVSTSLSWSLTPLGLSRSCGHSTALPRTYLEVLSGVMSRPGRNSQALKAQEWLSFPLFCTFKNLQRTLRRHSHSLRVVGMKLLTQLETTCGQQQPRSQKNHV